MKRNGSLVMEIKPQELVGEDTKATLFFQLAEPDKPVDLDKFQLKVSLENQERGIGSHLKYTDAENNLKKSKEIIETLTHFTKASSLGDNMSSFQVDLEVVPDIETTALKYKVELFSKEGDLVSVTSLSWDAYQELRLTQQTPKEIQGDNKDIKLNIHNPNINSTAAGKLKLVITRTEGAQATIEGAAPTIDEGKYEIALTSIAGNHESAKTLTIDPKKDLKASFSIQLYYQEKAQGKPVIISWEQGMLLTLGVEPKKGNPRIVTCNVDNKGTVSAKGIKLQYIARTDGVRLQGKPLIKDKIEEKYIGDIPIGAKGIYKELEGLDFGINSSADIEFRLVYDEGQTNPRLYTFTPLNVQLSIDKLHYDPIEGYITYSIRNDGNDVAEKVQIKYSNVSKDDEEGQEAELGGKKKDATYEVTIAPKTSTDEQRLILDFKKADKATFKFEVFYNNKIINQATRIETFEAKEVIIKLLPKDTTTGSILLIGANCIFQCAIEASLGRRPENIDLKHVRIDIIRKSNNNSFLSKTFASEYQLNSLIGSDIGKIGKSVTLCVNPSMAKEAQFDLHLYYKNVQQGMPLHIDWQEDQLKIEGLNLLVGNNEASFTLSNTVGPINPKEFTVELSSSKATHFNFTKTNEKPTRSVSLDALAECVKQATSNNKCINVRRLDTLIEPRQVAKNTPTAPIRFKLDKATDRISEAQVTVTVKRNGMELVSQPIMWKAEGVSLKVEESGTRFEDNAKLEIPIENVGRPVPMDEIRVEIVHNKGVCYKLGNVIGDNFSTTLNKVLGKSGTFRPKEKAKVMALNMEGELSQKEYTANLTLNIYHKQDSIYVKEFTWINKHLFGQTLKNLEHEINNLRVGFDKIDKDNYLLLQHDSDVSYIKWYNKAEQITLYKQEATAIQEKAKHLLSKLNPQIQVKEKEKVENEIVRTAEKLSADVNTYVSNTLQTIFEQNVATILQKAEEKLLNVTNKTAELKYFVSNDIEGAVTITTDTIQLFEDIILIRHATTQVNELLSHIHNLITDNIDKESIQEQIVKAKAKHQAISDNLKSPESVAIEVLSEVATKSKNKVKNIVEEIGISSKQIKALNMELNTYFDNPNTSFLKRIDDKIKQNLEELFLKFAKLIAEASPKAALAYTVVNTIAIQAHNAEIAKVDISSSKVKDLKEIDKEIKEMCESIQSLGSMNYKVAESMMAKAEQELQIINKNTQSTVYNQDIMQKRIEDAGKIFLHISEFYRVNNNKTMQDRALQIQIDFYNILNQLPKKGKI
jgi:hypothetical protein